MIVSESVFKADTKTSTRMTLLIEGVSKSLKGEKMIFISHKHGEADYVYRLRDLLSRYGFEGYVDWEDDQMPKETSGETAKKIKEEIKRSHKFILIATDAAISSKWCNWEVGFADAHKYSKHMALFPIRKDYSDYTGEEYLEIYPTIQVRKNSPSLPDNYYVKYSDGTVHELHDWLTY